MQQIFVIHGGTTFNTEAAFHEYLRNKRVTLEDLEYRDWKSRLSEDLGSDFRVFLPRMPNPQDARYIEWKLWFEKFLPLLSENVILIGHSLGGVFLAKYLSEEVTKAKVRATFLVAAPYNTAPEDGGGDFILTASLDLLAKQGGDVFFYHSSDDAVVPFRAFAHYQEVLPSATFRSFTDRGHFNRESVPELLADLRAIAAK